MSYVKKENLISNCFLHAFVNKDEILLGELKFSILKYSWFSSLISEAAHA